MEEDKSINYVIPLAIGIGVMTACGAVGFALVLLATLLF